MQSMAQVWLVYSLSGSSFVLGALGFAGQLPVFAFALFGGALADARDKRSIVVVTQVTSMLLAFATASLTLTGLIEVWQVFVLAVMLGIVNAFDLPTRQSFLVEMVGHDDLRNAIALNSSIFNAARMIGPSVAGVVMAAVGEGWCFFLNGVSFIPVIASLLMMRLPPRGQREAQPPALQRIREGFAFSVHHRGIRMQLLMVGWVSLVGIAYTVLMPVMAAEVFGGDASALGLLMSAAGGGALLGALALAGRRKRTGLRRWVLRAALGFGVGLILFSQCRWLWLGVVVLVPCGFCMVVLTAASNTLLQLMSPDAYRGRVMSLFSMMFAGMAPFGALLAGSAAHVFGAPGAIFSSGMAILVAAVGYGVWIRRTGDDVTCGAPEEG